MPQRNLPLYLLFPLFLHLLLIAAAKPPADAAALLSFKSAADPGGRRLRFFSTGNRSASAHCSWRGVYCLGDGKIFRLVLEGLGLNGSFPNATLSRLDQLRVLSLKGNSLAGPIPDLSGLLNLKALFLDHNLFSGPFPSSLLHLHRIRTLDLSQNLLSGPIPAGLASLDRLYSLRLDSNRFNESIPPLNQSTLTFFNVSSNDLSGAVPVTAALSGFGAAAFSGNSRLCGVVVRRECYPRFPFFGTGASGPSSAPSPSAQRQGFGLPGSPGDSSHKSHKKVVLAAGFLTGTAILLLLVGVCLAISMKKKKGAVGQGEMLAPEKSAIAAESTAEEVEERCDELVAAAAMTEEKMKRLGKSGSLVFCAGEAQVYTLEELMRASAEMLGRGSVGSTYKAMLDNRLILCVKRLDAAKIGMNGKEGFERHMEAVGRLRHPNLVSLRAYFQAKEERLLVYDYQPNGSLHSLIHGQRSTRAKPLHWTSCLKIAEDVAQGLAYIHQASGLVHGNIKSSNVLLGSDFEACLTDNCLSFLVELVDTGDNSGYRAPETKKSNRRLTSRSDIYAFGVLLIELLTSRPPLQHQFLVATDLPTWVRSVREDDVAVDDERLMMIVDIASACVRSSPESRPTTWQVLKMIQEVKDADHVVGDDDDDDDDDDDECADSAGVF